MTRGPLARLRRGGGGRQAVKAVGPLQPKKKGRNTSFRHVNSRTQNCTVPARTIGAGNSILTRPKTTPKKRIPSRSTLYPPPQPPLPPTHPPALSPDEKTSTHFRIRFRHPRHRHRTRRNPSPGRAGGGWRNARTKGPSSFHRPVVLGGESQCLSICCTARVHSAVQAFASCWTPAAVGDRLPHMAGLVANARA